MRNNIPFWFICLVLLVTAPITQLLLYDAFFYIRPFFVGEGQSWEIIFLYIFLIFLWFFFAVRIFSLRSGRNFYESASCKVAAFRQPSFLNLVLFYFIFPSISLISILNVVYHLNGSLDLFFPLLNPSQFYYASKGYSAVYFFVCYMFLVYAIVFISAYGFSFRRGACVVLALFLTLLWGGRSSLVNPLVFLFLVGIFYLRNSFFYRSSFIAGLMLFCVLVGLTISRSGEGSVAEYFSSKSSSLDFNSLNFYEYSLAYREKGGEEYFMNFEDLRHMFVPRFLDENKPVSTAETRYVWGEWSEGRFTNITFGIPGNFINNFGVLGYLFIPLFYCGVLVLSFCYIQSCLLGRASLFLLYFVSIFPFVLRGGVVNHRLVPVLLFFFVSLLLLKMLSFKISIYRKKGL